VTGDGAPPLAAGTAPSDVYRIQAPGVAEEIVTVTGPAKSPRPGENRVSATVCCAEE